MRVISLMIILFLVAPNAALSASMAYQGVGATTCGQFANAYRDDPNNVGLIYFSWAQGFMSGMNATLLKIHSGKARDLNSRSTDSEQLYLQSYCDKHPLASYVEAVITLFNDLPIISAK